MRFYLVAMIFIVFDIEIIFLFPWAVVYRALGAFGLVEIVIFAVAVFESFVYLIGNGALDWGPVKQAPTPTPQSSPARTAATHHPPRRPRGPRAGRDAATEEAAA